MERIKANVERVEDQYFIKLRFKDDEILIPMSEDNPNEVKKSFNKIILQIKVEEFQIELEEVGEDLFSQVAKEYITQLNREIHEVLGEMRKFGLIQ